MADGEITISELELADEVLGDMVMAVDTTSDTKSVSLRQLKAWLGSSLPTGFIIPAIGRISDERFTLLDGKTLARDGSYQAFCNKVVEQVQAGNWFACTAEEYESDLTNYDQCGKFVITNDYIRIPRITKFIGATVTLSEIGRTTPAGLPRIQVSGNVLTHIGSGGVAALSSGSTVLSSNSNINPIYGNSDTVTPTNVKFPYYMVVSTEGQTSAVEFDVNQIYEDMNLKADKDLSNVSTISQVFKEKITPLDVPDWSGEIAISNVANGFVYKTPAIGYLKINREDTDGAATCVIYKGTGTNGVKIKSNLTDYTVKNGGQFNVGPSFFMIKVGKDENYYFVSSNIARLRLSFVPCMGV